MPERRTTVPTRVFAASAAEVAVAVAFAVAMVAAALVTLASIAWPSVAQAQAASSTALLGTNVKRIPTQEKVVALTFDDCYNHSHLKSILATLASTGVKATFFVTGDCARSNPAGIQAIVAAGHDIGNHSNTHPWLTHLTNSQICSEVDKAETALAELGVGDPKPLFRVPFMAWNSRVLSVLGSEGYASILWTCDGSDYKSGRTVSGVVNTILGQLGPGAIILMHPDSGPTPAAVAELIRAIKGRGYRFVGLREALFPLDVSGRATPYVNLRGIDRYETAVRLSKAAFPAPLLEGSGLVLAPGETFPEALCGGPLAAAYGGPVLLTPASGLVSVVTAELQRLAPAEVICIGLSATVADQVQAAVPGAAVISISEPGNDASGMSRAVALALGAVRGDLSGAVAIVTRGDAFPDAIAVSPVACARKWPILLTGSGDTLDPSAATAMAELGITRALKVGTYAGLPDGVDGVGNCSGADRYATNRNIVQWSVDMAGLSFAHVGLTTGEKFPDALAAGPYLAMDGGVLLLSPLNGPLPAGTGALITANASAVGRLSFIAMVEPVISHVRVLLP